jgi:hypothetical protein
MDCGNAGHEAQAAGGKGGHDDSPAVYDRYFPRIMRRPAGMSMKELSLSIKQFTGLN